MTVSLLLANFVAVVGSMLPYPSVNHGNGGGTMLSIGSKFVGTWL
jgi:hypothetical protein